MNLYHSRLTQDYLNDLIIKYKIPRDLHPRLPSEEFVMSELPDNAIGIYHRMFDFSSVLIPFSSFLLALIKHYRVNFSQLGPLGLNKVITFEVLYRSSQIEPTVTLFRVFKRYVNKKSGFFLIDRRAILDSMVWRHPNAAIDDPRPATGSFSMADMRRLSAHVIKLRDMPEGVLVLSGLSRVWKSRVCDLVLRGADGNVMGIHDFLCLPEWTGAEDLAIGTPSSKILAKAEALQKRKASIFSATSSHVAKRTSDGDDDASGEIPLVTPLRSIVVNPSSGNQGRSSNAPNAEGSNTRDSQGKGIMVDDVVAPFVGASRPRLCSRPAPSFRDVFGDAIHTNFFPFSAVEALSEDQLTAKMSVLHCIMMSHGGKKVEERVAGVAGLELQVSTLKKHATVLEAEKDEEILRLKATPPEFASFFGGQFQDLVRKFLASDEFSRVQGELLSLAASAGFERGLSMHRTKDEFVAVLKKMANFMPRVDCAPASKSLELSTNADLAPSVVASEHNEEMGIYVALEDVVELVVIGSGCASSGPNDVVVALSAGEKGDGLVPSSATGEGRVVCQRTIVAPSLGKTDCRCVVVHPVDLESCHPP
ncbi:hypothetical protein Tco_0803854 [Tanacetum coccineum]|uniref:Transposase (putative) gypsy type domain-containing protein n=1 Tax=Tanacetum coccineum TaxID=301880 RepID=A0ABQ5A5I9_9ASTR